MMKKCIQLYTQLNQTVCIIKSLNKHSHVLTITFILLSITRLV